MVAITLVGKILGLVRDMLMGHNFATGMEIAAFQVASRIPRTFFDVVFASAISASFIPVFNDRLERQGEKDAFALSNSFFTWVGLLTALFSGVGIVMAEPIVGLLADGFDPETVALCASFLRILFSTVFFTGLAFSLVGVLQSLGQFLIPAALSVVSNGIVILYYLLFREQYGIYGLCWAFLLGWAGQAVMQIPWLHKRGFRYRFSLRHPALKNVILLMLPVMVSTWVQPLNQLVSARFATHLFSGAGVSAMDYANTIYTMITGILVLSITNVIFPEMSRLNTEGKDEELGDLITTSIRGMLFLLVPLTAGMVVLAEPIIRLLFEYKSWDGFSTEITARALMYMSLGMVGYGIQNVLSRAFYAGQQGRLPLLSGVASIMVNVALCMLLTERFDVAGLSMATAVSSLVAAVILLIPTMRRYKAHWGGMFWFTLAKMTVAAVGMGIVVLWFCNTLQHALTDGLVTRVLVVALPTVVGVLVYFILTLFLRVPESHMVKDEIVKRLPRSGGCG